jgi:hypothetical protein
MLQNTGSSIENKFLKGNEGGVNRIKKKDKMKMRAALLQKKIHVIKLLKEEDKGIGLHSLIEHWAHSCILTLP